LKEEKSTISHIIATHWHDDHIGSIRDVQLKNLVTDDCKVWKFPRSDAKEDYGDLSFLELTDGQEFEMECGMKVKVLHTPGHTTDHCILHDQANNSVFAGDCILGEGTAVFEDLFDYMKSLELILSLKPTLIYPGHSDVINDPVERIEYYINHRNERERQILDAILSSKEALKDMEIVGIVYTTTPRYLWGAAAKNVNQHLIKLKKEGKIIEVEKNKAVYWQAAQSNKL
jgi:endoribonuclease LACTB2